MASGGYSFQAPEQAIKILLQCALFYLTDKDNALEYVEKCRHKLAASEQLSKIQFNEITGVIWEILKSFLQSAKDEKSHSLFIKQIVQLSKDPPVSKEFAVNILESLQTERDLLELKFHEKTTTRVFIKKISYRFDISAIGVGDQPVNPVLILNLLLSNGKRMTFRVPYGLFHRLRFSTARLLKEIQFLETRKIITR